MRSSAARKRREDEAQLNVWSYVAPSPSGDLKRDLIQVMQDMAREKDKWGVTIGEAVERYERTTGKRVGGEPRATKQEEQRQTSWLARLGVEAGLVPTNEVRRSPVKRHHGNRHTVYVWPSVADVKR